MLAIVIVGLVIVPLIIGMILAHFKAVMIFFAIPGSIMGSCWAVYRVVHMFFKD
jgi:hypothetical protein